MYYTGIAIGAGTFLIIALLHPIVIKAEYYAGKNIWPLFLICGLGCIGFSLFVQHPVISGLAGILGFCLLWGILELFEQEKRVAQGRYPLHPRRLHKQAGLPKRSTDNH